MEKLKRKCSPKKLKRSLRDLSKLKNAKEKKAEKISKPKRFDCYVAVAEYQVQASGEIALQPGLKVEVLEKSDSGWWFVNSEDEQGWVPSTYLEPEGGANPEAMQGPFAAPGQEETFICIEKFGAASADEVSLDKGTVVQVLQKNMDGWWLVRYKDREAYAPGTYLKKASNAQTVRMVEKSRLSGVEIISSLQDVSTLLNQESKSSSEDERPTSVAVSKPKVSAVTAKQSAIVKQRSLERGGSLIPPPRQNSVTKMRIPSTVTKSSIYVTAEDFSDTVGDGLSFKKGQKVHVKEKTPTGWWFVSMGAEEGWVPATYLEPYTGSMDTPSLYELASQEDQENESNGEEFDDDDDDDEWHDEPDIKSEGPAISSIKGKRPLPPIPPEENEPNKATTAAKNASRPLPPPPPAEVKPSVGAKLPEPPKKPVTVKNSVNAARSTPSPELPKKSNDSKSGPAGGPQDLAAVLKAKFEARAGASGDSGNSSEEENGKSSKPVVPKFQKDNKPAASKPQVPILPTKPSDLKKESRETSPRPISVGGDKKFPKPPPPAAKKPITPSKPTSDAIKDTPKPALPSFPLKPTPNSASKPAEKPEPPQMKGNVKSMMAAFSNGQNPKPAVGEKPKPGKPQLASKPKPAVTSKPSIPNKTVQSEPKSGQGVGKLVNSLSGKLNFGSGPPGNHSGTSETNSSPGPAPPPPAIANKLPASSSVVPPGSSTYRALYDFLAENEGELGFSEGDEVEVLEQNGDWYLISFWDETGWAPANFFEKM